jgi:hypothetical protein
MKVQLDRWPNCRRQDFPNSGSEGLSVERFREEWQIYIIADDFAHFCNPTSPTL